MNIHAIVFDSNVWDVKSAGQYVEGLKYIPCKPMQTIGSRYSFQLQENVKGRTYWYDDDEPVKGVKSIIFREKDWDKVYGVKHPNGGVRSGSVG